MDVSLVPFLCAKEMNKNLLLLFEKENIRHIASTIDDVHHTLTTYRTLPRLPHHINNPRSLYHTLLFDYSLFPHPSPLRKEDYIHISQPEYGIHHYCKESFRHIPMAGQGVAHYSIESGLFTSTCPLLHHNQT